MKNDTGMRTPNAQTFSAMPMPADCSNPSELTIARITRNDTPTSTSCRAEVEDGDQKQITEDIHDARDGDRDERHFGIAEPAEDAADDVERDDEQRAGRADAHVLRRGVEGLLRRLQQTAEGRGQRHKQGGQSERDADEQTDGRADDAAGFVGLSLADFLPEQDGHARRQADEQRGDQLHGLATGRDGGDIRRTREFADDDQIDRAVHRLQKQRQQHRACKAQQRRKDASVQKIILLFLHTRLQKKGRIKPRARARHLIQPNFSHRPSDERCIF